jgi:membrane-associated phospholipid phosphatase
LAGGVVERSERINTEAAESTEHTKKSGNDGEARERGMNNLERGGYSEGASPIVWQAEAITVQGAGNIARFETRGEGITARVKRELSATWAACGAFEWVALGYLGVSSALVMAFAENVAHPVKLIGVQVLVATLILVLCRMEKLVTEPFAQNWWHFWRHWYPHLFFLFCFEELGKLVHLISPAWRDEKLIAFDHWLTGVHPAVWLEQFATPARNEFMQFAYLTYFLYLLVLGGILYYRKDWKGYWSVMTYSAVGYAIGYVIAIVFPIESPWFAMAGSWHGELRGGACTAVINFIEHFGRVRGAAFPSEHVAGSFAAVWGAWRHRRWLFWVMLPLVMCMCVSTVWGRYHYVADVFGGIITGTLGYVIGRWVMRKQEEVAL